MRKKTIAAALGLALALALAAAGGGPASGGEAGAVVAVSADDAPAVTVPLVHLLEDVAEHPTVPRYSDVPRQTPPAPPPVPEPQPVPEPTAAPAPPPAQAAPGSVHDIIARHFGGAAAAATRIAQCESGLDPGAVSPGGGNHGLFQINDVHRGTFESVTGAPWSAVYDADANTRFARWLHGQQGWGPWACA